MWCVHWPAQWYPVYVRPPSTLSLEVSLTSPRSPFDELRDAFAALTPPPPRPTRLQRFARAVGSVVGVVLVCAVLVVLVLGLLALGTLFWRSI